MSVTALVRLAWRLLLRDWRAGELRILALSLVIAVTGATLIAFFTARLQTAMEQQATELLGGDIVLSTPRPVPDAWLAQGRALGLRSATTLEFASMIAGPEAFQLASVKAVGGGYPLYGALRTQQAAGGAEQTAVQAPPPGEAWVESRLLGALAIGLGDHIEIGAATFRVTRLLSYEPDRGATFYSMNPRVLINLAEVARTQVVQPGSRVRWRYLLAGEEAASRAFKTWLAPQLEPSHRLLNVREDRPAVGSALDRAEQYLGLASLIAVLLAGVAIAMGARRYSERHFDMSAMLRCLGASQRTLVQLYLLQLLVVGLAASLVGCALGYVGQEGLFQLLRGLLPVDLPAPGWAPLGVGVLTGLATLAGFGLPPVLRLQQVSPLRVLRRELRPLPTSAWVTYGVAGLTVLLLMIQYTNNLPLTLIMLLGGALVTALAALLAFWLLRLCLRLKRWLGWNWRFGLTNLQRRGAASIGQMLAFGLTLMAMALILLVRTDLLQTWQQQAPADAPNHFAVNILPFEVDAMQRFLRDNAVADTGLYPMVRGRLAEINGVRALAAVAPEAREQNALHRELNLTWSSELPADNRIVAGRWWQPQDHGQALISVEREMAAELGLQLGDELTFTLGGATLKATIHSLRTVEWESFRPNFYVIFPPGVLERYPLTYITSFHLPPARKGLVNELVRRFPAVSVLDVDQILAQVRLIVEQVTLAIEYVLAFVLLAGFAVLFAALQASLDVRLYEGALFRTLGAQTRQLRHSQLAEFLLLGLLAGLLAALGTELIAWALYTQVFELSYRLQWAVWLLAPAAGAVLIGAAGYWGTRRVCRQSPLLVLRDL